MCAKLTVHLLLQVEEAELARLLAPQGLALRDIPVRLMTSLATSWLLWLEHGCATSAAVPELA